MSDEKDFDSLLLGRAGAPAVKFASHGDFIEGTLVGKDTQHKAKFNANDPSDRTQLEYFASGDPKLELILTLQTDRKDHEEDKGVRRVFVPFQMQSELQKAVVAAGMKHSLPLGTHIKITHTHSVPSEGGGSPRKEYSVVVRSAADEMVAPKAKAVDAPKATKPAHNLTPELVELMRQNGM